MRRNPNKLSPKRMYLIPLLSKALDVLELLQNERSALTPEAIFQRTNISKTTVCRILKTLTHRGYLAQSQDGVYRLVAPPKKARFGFGSQSADMPFSEAVTDSLRAAASAAGVDLMVLDNRYDGPTALRNADEFVQNNPDLVIEFQIAVDIPHPHATFFGINNYRVGFEAGECLAGHGKTNWDGKVKWVLGLYVEEAGALVHSRITGTFEGIRSKLPDIPDSSLVRMDGRGMREKSYRLVLDFLRRHPKDREVLIAAATDTSALGAVQAVRELKWEKYAAIVGQDCIPEELDEMSTGDSPLIASVSHEAQSYGPRLIQLGLAILSGQRIAPYNYVEHKLVRASSLRRVK
jgi:ribose transport system substrate-binding protein